MPFGFPLFVKGSFSPSTDIPSLAGRVIIVTGGNAGIGKETILKLAEHGPAHIYLFARTESKALEAIKDIQSAVPNSPPISFIKCDLTSLVSVQEAARQFVGKEKRLDLLILNAGIMATPAGTTEQGYEVQFGTNHVGHALLTKLLLTTLLETAKQPGGDARVIAVSSAAHQAPPANGIVFNELKTDMASTFTTLRYGQSKLANVLFAKELAKRYPQLTAVSIHPGIVYTDLYSSMSGWSVMGKVVDLLKRMVCVSVQVGAKNQLWAATAKDVKTGEYYNPVAITGQGSKMSEDAQLAQKLWSWTEAEIEGYEL